MERLFKFYSMKFAILFLNYLVQKKLTWINNKALFEKWKDGETGYPFIDANMIELKKTGFMSNRGRQVVASFLLKTSI